MDEEARLPPRRVGSPPLRCTRLARLETQPASDAPNDVYLVSLVYLVYLVYLVFLVFLVYLPRLRTVLRPSGPRRPSRLSRRSTVSDVNARHAQAHTAQDFVRDGLRPGRHFVGADDIAEQLRDIAHRHGVVTHVCHQAVHAHPPRDPMAVTADQHLAPLAGQPWIPVRVSAGDRGDRRRGRGAERGAVTDRGPRTHPGRAHDAAVVKHRRVEGFPRC